jgi:hypothetical protein
MEDGGGEQLAFSPRAVHAPARDDQTRSGIQWIEEERAGNPIGVERMMKRPPEVSRSKL